MSNREKSCKKSTHEKVLLENFNSSQFCMMAPYSHYDPTSRLKVQKSSNKSKKLLLQKLSRFRFCMMAWCRSQWQLSAQGHRTAGRGRQQLRAGRRAAKLGSAKTSAEAKVLPEIFCRLLSCSRRFISEVGEGQERVAHFVMREKFLGEAVRVRAAAGSSWATPAQTHRQRER